MSDVDAIGYAAIGLVRPKVRQNVGGVLRAATCFGVALVGITGHRYRAQRTDTTRAHLHIPLLHVDDLRSIIPYDCVPVAVERIAGAISLPDYVHPDRAFYIFGPEDGDLGRSTLHWCRDVISIPSLDALNLAAAVNIVLYDRVATRTHRA